MDKPTKIGREMTRLVFTILILLNCHIVFSQGSLKDVEEYMNQIRQDPSLPVPISIFREARNEDRILRTIYPFLTDTLDHVRSKALYIIKRLGQKSTNSTVRQSAVHHLVGAIRDKDTGISGNASSALTGFNKENFSQVDKDSIGRYIRPQIAHLDQVIKLAGYLGLIQHQPKIIGILNSNLDFKYRWAARLALARMGDREAINYISSKLGNAKVNDDFVYDVVPDLVYTRQKEIFKFLEGVINSDQANCLSANADSDKKILCGYRVMESIALAVVNYPIPLDESGDLNTNDYEGALRTVRTWLAQNPNYAIRQDQY